MGVWISNDDGSNLVQISNPHDDQWQSAMVAGRKKIAFDSRPLIAGKYLWPTWPNGYPESWSQISPTLLDLTGPAMESWIYFRSTNLAGGVYRCPHPAEMPLYYPKMSMATARRSLSMGRHVYFASHEWKSTLKRVALPGQPSTESEVDGFHP